jgi:hypothetical protein
MAKFVFVLAFLLAFAVVEKASAAPTFCTWVDGVPDCGYDNYFDGPA